ncbi:MAG: TOBE domain-containing protein, partial [Planctomycetota bacterium]|nr:TOBE domain-containing protein [Planctomycetota bacterium]
IRVRVPRKYDQSIFPGDEVILGVRPTDVLVDNSDSLATEAPITVFENLGDERRISIDVGNDEFLTLITEDEKRYRQGDHIRLSFRETKTHIFNQSTGERIIGH